ncbi:MAG: glycosyltransferase [Candidatus Moranbacteria bacterium]|nr:glycosyltransferase [Candidatus Moranbacteria bacterium]
MKISYITMQFPAPSETFASSDIQSLNKLNPELSVYSLKSKHSDYNRMIKDRKLQNISIFTCKVKENILGLIEIIKSPFLFISLLFWLIKNDLKKTGHFIRCFALIPASFYILSQLKKEKPDVVHLFWGHYPSLVGFLVKRVLKNSKISMFLGAYDLEYNLNISKDLAKNADFIFTHAKANIPQLNKMNIKTDKINVIHRGINIKDLSLVIENIDKKSNQIICAGRFLPDKGFDKVIDIFSKLHKNINSSNLVLVGYGSAQSDLEKQTIDLKIESNVTFTGYLSQNDVLKFMVESDIFLFLSSKAGERLPNVVKEAMLAGCICIVSNTPGIDELIEHGKTGFIIESNNYDLIPNLISSLDEIKKEEIRTNAKEFILKNFDVELSMKKYINIWESNE